MASGVFGTPISVETVRATGEYTEPITQKNVADYAMRMINAGGKDTNAQQFVDNLKGRYGDGISAKCLIYNATGATLEFVTYKDRLGHIFDTPYPSHIQNGQWGAFLHVHPTAKPFPHGSVGAVVYRSSSVCDWLFSWCIPWVGDNGVYTKISEIDYFSTHWDDIYNELERAGRNSNDNGYGYVSKADIGEGTTVNARAVFQLPY